MLMVYNVRRRSLSDVCTQQSEHDFTKYMYVLSSYNLKEVPTQRLCIISIMSNFHHVQQHYFLLFVSLCMSIFVH